MTETIEASTTDIPVIRQLARTTWYEVYPSILERAQIDYMLHVMYSEETLTRAMETGAQVFLLLYEEGIAKGFASYGTEEGDPCIGKLHKLYVLPEAHGKGFGRLLLKAVKQRVRSRGASTLRLNVNRYNPAKVFYEKMGFQVIREEDIPIGPYWMNDYVMSMAL